MESAVWEISHLSRTNNATRGHTVVFSFFFFSLYGPQINTTSNFYAYWWHSCLLESIRRQSCIVQECQTLFSSNITHFKMCKKIIYFTKQPKIRFVKSKQQKQDIISQWREFDCAKTSSITHTTSKRTVYHIITSHEIESVLHNSS